MGTSWPCSFCLFRPQMMMWVSLQQLAESAKANVKAALEDAGERLQALPREALGAASAKLAGGKAEPAETMARYIMRIGAMRGLCVGACACACG